jgi:Holliday junction resolvase-like predicted endonuclease
MERLTRQQMVAEFGDTGVENPMVLDLVTLEGDTVVLVMIERRRWGAAAQQLTQIEEKINRYMAYALDGFLVQHYPQYQGKAVQIRLDCVEAPQGEVARFVQAAAQSMKAYALGFAVNVVVPGA